MSAVDPAKLKAKIGAQRLALKRLTKAHQQMDTFYRAKIAEADSMRRKAMEMAVFIENAKVDTTLRNEWWFKELVEIHRKMWGGKR